MLKTPWLLCLLGLAGLAACDSGSGGGTPAVDAQTTDGVVVPIDMTSVDAALPRDQGPDAGCGCTGAQTCDEGRCVEPAQCAGAADCLPGRGCFQAACRDRCAGDDTCAPTERCDGAEQVCVPDTRCRVDADCGPDGLCIERACFPRCQEGTCPGAQVCDVASGRCREPVGCTEDTDCLNGRVCRANECVSACVEDAGCMGAQRCVDGQCAEPAVCTGDLDCLRDRRCTAGQCADACTVAGCPGAQLCDVASGRCGEANPCVDDTGCFDGRRCLDGVCGAPCLEDAACPGGQNCLEGRCTEPDVCRGALDCLEGRVCARGACRDHCDRLPCDGSQACDRATGVCGEASPCRADDGCFPGNRCVNSACVAPCRENADCPGAMSCTEGACTEPPSCVTSLDCLGDRGCAGGRCVDACVNGTCRGARRCVDDLCVEGPGCMAPADCDRDRACHPDAQICVPRCPDGRCPGLLICGEGALCEEAACVADVDCIGDRGCRLSRCRAVECEDHTACPGERCRAWVCSPAEPAACPAGWVARDGHCEQPGPCVANTCPAGTLCGANGRCALCANDNDCPGGTRCRAGACADADPCAGDGDCLPGHTCFGQTCAVAACAEDLLAPNHDPNSATLLPLMDQPGLRACEGRPDYFRVGGLTGIRVTARFAADRPPLRLRLLPAAGGEAVDVSDGVPGEAWVNAGPGDWLLEVTAPPGASGDYRLALDAPVACADDRYERPWRNDAEARATPVAAGRFAATLCDRDEDWFRYAGAGRIHVAVEGGVRATVNGQAAPLDVQGPVSIRVTGAGAYTLEITGDNSPAGRCVEAAILPLATPTAVEIGADANSFNAACLPVPGGADRPFRVDVGQAGVLTATLLDPAPGASLALYSDCAGAALSCADRVGLLRVPVAVGRYFLVVEGPYAGRVQVDVAAGDAFCANPPLLGAAPVEVRPRAMSPDLGGACLAPNGDAAVFQFSLATASQVTVSYAGSGPQGRLSLRTACADGAAEFACVAGVDPSVARRLAAGIWYVVAQGVDRGQLSLAIEPGPMDNRFEDRCLPAGAAPRFSPGDHLQLAGDTAQASDAFDSSACGAMPGGADRVLQFETAVRVRLVVTAQPGPFTPTLSVRDNDCLGDPQCGAAGGLDVVLAPGNHALVVDSEGPIGGPFSLDFQVIAAP